MYPDLLDLPGFTRIYPDLPGFTRIYLEFPDIPDCPDSPNCPPFISPRILKLFVSLLSGAFRIVTQKN
jgi:hypothetical protein